MMKNLLIHFVSGACCTFLFVACSASGNLSTPSGKPEIVVSGSAAQAMQKIGNWLLENNYKYYTAGDTLLVGQTDEKESLKKTNLYFHLAPSGSGTRVILNEMYKKGEREIYFENQETYERDQKLLKTILS